MTQTTVTHFVFVDFENVPEVDLGLVEGKPVQVTLFIGKHQKKLDLALVRQIHRLAAQVELVEVGASGRNALDLTLAYYLGQTVERAPGAHFHLVSKDKDFEAMIGHLQGKHLKVARCDSFTALPFLPKPAKSRPLLAPAKVSAGVKTVEATKEGEGDDRLEKLIHRLKNNSAPRPKKRARLLAHISTAFGGKLPEAEQVQKLGELVERGVLRIDAKERVTYAAGP